MSISLRVLPAGVTHRQVIVRHGEPVATSAGRCYGKLDVALSDRGRAQVAAATNRVRTRGVQILYASPRIRATQSAEILADALGLPMVVDERLAEIDFGRFEGLTYEACEAEFPELYARWMRAPTQVQFPEGESFAQMKARVLAAGREYRDRHGRASVGIVAHGGVGRIVLADALGLPDPNIFRIGQDYAAVSTVDFFGDVPLVRECNWCTRVEG